MLSPPPPLLLPEGEGASGVGAFSNVKPIANRDTGRRSAGGCPWRTNPGPKKSYSPNRKRYADTLNCLSKVPYPRKTSIRHPIARHFSDLILICLKRKQRLSRTTENLETVGIITRRYSDDRKQGHDDLGDHEGDREDPVCALTEESEVGNERMKKEIVERNRAEEAVTERRRLERVLEESEERFRLAFEQAAVGMAHVAQNGTWLRVNRKLSDIVGYSNDELMALTFQDITHPDDLAVDQEYVNQMLRREIKTYSMEKRYIRKDRAVVWINLTVSLTRRESGEPDHFIYVVEDISDRKHAEEELFKEKRFADTALNSLPGVFFVFDEEGRFLRWNRNFETVTGRTGDEMCNLHPLDLFHGEEKNAVGLAIEEVFTKNESSVEAHLVAKNGLRTPYYFTGRSIPLDGGRGVAGMGIDISDRKKAEAAVLQKTKALEAAAAELQQFTYITSHHLQEPLRRIINFSELVRQRYHDSVDEKGRHYLNIIVDGALKMRSLISELQNYLRMDRVPPSRKKTSMDGLLSSVMAALSDEIKMAEATINADHLPRVTVDPGEFKNLLIHLISNAIKFKGPAPPRIRISASERQGDWLFSVQDNGIGVDPKYHERIFDIFQRLHTPAGHPGTGVGPALCRKVIQRHGGSLWIESESGNGSAFYFTIPRSQEVS